MATRSHHLPRPSHALLALCLLAAPAAAAAQEAPIGNWLTQDRDAVIAIAPCGKALCGQVAGVPLAIPNEPVPTDNHGRSQCHLTILSDVTPSGTQWQGRILDPRNGHSYAVTLWLDGAHTLKVHGYLGIPLLGRTETWTPFTRPLPADCRLPPRDPAPPAPTPPPPHGPAHPAAALPGAPPA